MSLDSMLVHCSMMWPRYPFLYKLADCNLTHSPRLALFAAYSLV